MGLGKRPLVWDQESGSNPVARLRRRPYSLVLGLAVSSQVTEVVRVHLGLGAVLGTAIYGFCDVILIEIVIVIVIVSEMVIVIL